MRTQDIPSSLFAVAAEFLFSDTTCGKNARLSSYVVTDKYGPGQNQVNYKVLNSDKFQIEIQTTDSSKQFEFLNSFKSEANVVFEQLVETTVFGYYTIECNNCDPVVFLRLFVHTLSPTTSNDILKIYSDYIELDTSGNQREYEIKFNVTENGEDTFIAGKRIPKYNYKGIGYEFIGLGSESAITLKNPIVSTADSRQRCLTRETPSFVEPKPRIKSSAPNHYCNFEDDEAIGTCKCDYNKAGDACQYVAIDGKLCGGWGTIASLIVNPLNQEQFIQTENLGGFIYEDTNGVVYSDCKNLNMGNVIYSTLVPNTISEFSRVYVESIPIDGNKLMFEVENDIYLNKQDIEETCELEAARLAFFLNNDEVTRSIREFEIPYMIDITQDDTDFDFPDDNFLVENAVPISFNVCTEDLNLCSAINFNNLAYGLLDDLTDGIVNTTATAYTSPLTLGFEIEVEFTVYAWDTESIGTGAIDCTGSGFCNYEDNVEVEADLWYRVFTCRCPVRQLTVAVGLNEVQVFDLLDETRSTFYPYIT